LQTFGDGENAGEAKPSNVPAIVFELRGAYNIIYRAYGTIIMVEDESTATRIVSRFKSDGVFEIRKIFFCVQDNYGNLQ